MRVTAAEERKVIIGKLKYVTEAGITLQESETRRDVDLKFDSIEESKVEIDWGRTTRS